MTPRGCLPGEEVKGMLGTLVGLLVTLLSGPDFCEIHGEIDYCGGLEA